MISPGWKPDGELYRHEGMGLVLQQDDDGGWVFTQLVDDQECLGSLEPCSVSRAMEEAMMLATLSRAAIMDEKERTSKPRRYAA